MISSPRLSSMPNVIVRFDSDAFRVEGMGFVYLEEALTVRNADAYSITNNFIGECGNGFEAVQAVTEKKSEISKPLSPPGRNLRKAGVRNPILRPPELINFLSGGSGCPANFSKVGLWSNVSTWLGPPPMKSEITEVARGLK